MSKVFVVGMGIVSSIGKNIEENRNSLRQGKTGIGKIKFLESIHSSRFPAGEVSLSNIEMREILGLTTNLSHYYNRSSLLAMMAVKEALLNLNKSGKIKTAFISGNSLGGMSLTEDNYANYKYADPKIFNDYTFAGETTETIADFIGGVSYLSTVNTACSSSSNAIIHGTQLIKTGRVERAIVGGCDSLARFSLNGFNTLMILSDNQCKPFDEFREGLNLGEGAAYLVLESEALMLKNSHIPLAELTGYYNANDAFHQTASSPDGDGAFDAMKGAISQADINPDDISLIHAHGTATLNNDLSEANAMNKVFNVVPPFWSSKSYVGHTLGAAGSVNAVYSILSILNQEVYPSINIDHPMPEVSFQAQTKYIDKFDVEHVVSNAFGFGGNNTSLVFSKVEEGSAL